MTKIENITYVTGATNLSWDGVEKVLEQLSECWKSYSKCTDEMYKSLSEMRKHFTNMK